jgi:hypothetical protein
VISRRVPPPGYDSAPPRLRHAFDTARIAAAAALSAYREAARAAGGRRDREVSRLFGSYTAAADRLGRTRAALDDPVHVAVDTLLSIGAWGLHDSHRDDVWVIAIQASRALDGDPMTAEEVDRFRESLTRRAGRSFTDRGGTR